MEMEGGFYQSLN